MRAHGSDATADGRKGGYTEGSAQFGREHVQEAYGTSWQRDISPCHGNRDLVLKGETYEEKDLGDTEFKSHGSGQDSLDAL